MDKYIECHGQRTEQCCKILSALFCMCMLRWLLLYEQTSFVHAKASEVLCNVWKHKLVCVMMLNGAMNAMHHDNVGSILFTQIIGWIIGAEVVEHGDFMHCIKSWQISMRSAIKPRHSKLA